MYQLLHGCDGHVLCALLGLLVLSLGFPWLSAIEQQVSPLSLPLHFKLHLTSHLESLPLFPTNPTSSHPEGHIQVLKWSFLQ